MAKLFFRYGAMGCGKTAQLLQVAFNYEEKGLKVAVLKPEEDTRRGAKLYTRIGLERDSDYLIKKDDDLFKIIKDKFSNVNCILIDEAQFLKSKQIDDLMKVVVYLNKPVICYGIRTDFLTNGFPGSTRLLEIAHSIEELKTICKCGKKAIFNVRYVNGKVSTDGDSVVIDDSDDVQYVSMCHSCYYETLKNS